MKLDTNMNVLSQAVPLLEAVGLQKTYSKLETPVFDGLDLRVEAGTTLAIMGTSGSGKSSLLHLLGGLDTPTRGQVRLFGENLAALSISSTTYCQTFLRWTMWLCHYASSEYRSGRPWHELPRCWKP